VALAQFGPIGRKLEGGVEFGEGFGALALDSEKVAPDFERVGPIGREADGFRELDHGGIKAAVLGEQSSPVGESGREPRSQASGFGGPKRGAGG